MPQHTIVFLDDDHVMRLGRYALARPPQVDDDWVRAFFAPEAVDPQAVLKLSIDGSLQILPYVTEPAQIDATQKSVNDWFSRHDKD